MKHSQTKNLVDFWITVYSLTHPYQFSGGHKPTKRFLYGVGCAISGEFLWKYHLTPSAFFYAFKYPLFNRLHTIFIEIWSQIYKKILTIQDILSELFGFSHDSLIN